MPQGGRCNIYPVEQIQRLIQERDAAAQPQIPEGFVDKDGACRMFGVSRFVWRTWIRQGKVRIGQIIASPNGGRRKLYAIQDLERLKEQLFGEDKLYKRADGHFHVPAGYLRREVAWAMFGVSKPTWERWEREGKITIGQRVPGGPKLYEFEAVKRRLTECGSLTPPYPDPIRPGCYRVPLTGHGIVRKEAIIDADVLPLLEGGTCHWSQTGSFGNVSFYATNGENHVPLRRLILGITDRKAQIGHANDDPLDCRRENLVVRTVTQRQQHKRKTTRIAGRPPSSRFKGVYWELQTKMWRASISTNGRNRKLGRFRDEVAAAVAYDEAAQQWFGEHARLNFPSGVDAWFEQQVAQRESERQACAERTAA